MKPNFIKFTLSTIVFSFFIIALNESNESKQEGQSNDTSIQNNLKQSDSETKEPVNSPSE